MTDAWAALQAGRYDLAAALYQQVLAADPGDVAAAGNLGVALEALGRDAEAEAAFRRAVALAPNLAEAHSSLGYVLFKLSRPKDSMAACRRAIALRPDLADAHSNLSAALVALGRAGEAAEAAARALRLNPGHKQAHVNLGFARQAGGDLAGAEAACRAALAIAPLDADAHFNLSTVLLTQGRWREGFAEYEYRWRGARDGAPPLVAGPMWDGRDIAGRTLLVWAEQGFGDTLQFVRFLPRLAAATGARIVFQAQAPLLPLLRGIKGVAELLPQGGPCPAFDAHLPLLGIPHALGEAVEPLPPPPYLAADPALVAAWAPTFAGPRPKVGIVWTGSPDNSRAAEKTFPLEMAAELVRKTRHVEWFSLQVGARAVPGAVDLAPRLADFADTAAVLSHLDLCVTMDTATAHLAGALGRPAWVLLAFSADWRWLHGRDDSPWYPSVRLFRQKAPGKWATVTPKVASSIKTL